MVLLFFILALSSIGICGAQHWKDTFLREQRSFAPDSYPVKQ